MTSPLQATNTVRFYNNNTIARYTVIRKKTYLDNKEKIREFVDEEILNPAGKLQLPAKRPKAIISLIGGAKYYESNAKLDLVVQRGFIKAAQSLGAWIMDGGMHAGVMRYVGESFQTMAQKEIPCIGVAPFLKVNHNEELRKEDHCVYTMTTDNAGVKNLDPNHTHFILVRSLEAQWGEETAFLNELQNVLATERHIPVIVIALNGGGVTLESILNGLKSGFPTIIIKGTGRVCDALASLVSVAKRINLPPEKATIKTIKKEASEGELKKWYEFYNAEEEGDNSSDQMKKLKQLVGEVLKHYNGLTVFDPKDEDNDGLDVLVLKKFLKASKDPLIEQLKTIIDWGDRPELVAQLIKKNTAKEQKENPYGAALVHALKKNRPKIFNVLCENHAYYAEELRELYTTDIEVTHQLNRGHLSLWRSITGWPDAIRNQTCTTMINKRVPSNPYNKQFEQVLDIFAAIGPAFSEYACLCSTFFDKKPDHTTRTTRLSFIDLLTWAVFTNRFELAQVIWRRTKYHVLSGVMASILYRFLAENAVRTQEYLAHAMWFEERSLRILSDLEYPEALDLITFMSPMALGKATLTDLAAEGGGCKTVMAHPHVQQRLDELLYSYKEHMIPSSLSTFQLFVNVLLHLPRSVLRICSCKPTTKAQSIKTEDIPLLSKEEQEANAAKHTDTLYTDPTIFFNVPIVKFWTNTFSYILFLVFQAYILLTLRSSGIVWPEYLLWGWVLSMLIEEAVEMLGPDSTGYFSHFTNKMDVTLLFLNVLYIVLRLSHQRTDNFVEFSASINALLAACVIGWLRLMSIFPVSSTFGPLFFILIKLFKKDFLLWAVLFTIFAVSFQIGFTSLALQAGMDPYEAYPAENGIFPVSYVAIIGEWAYLMSVMSKTPTGVLFLAVYAFIVQVMLVNLLIAMMGDTYSSMRENSDVEWKYYRHTFVSDNTAVNSVPPPLNILHLAYVMIKKLRANKKQNEELSEEEQHKNEQKIAKVMRITVDKLVEEMERDDNLSPVFQIKKVKKVVKSRATSHEVRKLYEQVQKNADTLRKLQENQERKNNLLHRGDFTSKFI